MKKKVIASIMIFSCMFAAGGLLVIPHPVNAASVIKHRIPTTSSTQKVELSYLEKHTSFSKDVLSDLYDKGFDKDDIKNLYVLKNMSGEKFEDIISLYKNEKKAVKTVLKDYGINEDKFQKEFNKTFPAGEDTNFDRAQRIKNLRYSEF